jgi:hypothetical protein
MNGFTGEAQTINALWMARNARFVFLLGLYYHKEAQVSLNSLIRPCIVYKDLGSTVPSEFGFLAARALQALISLKLPAKD